MRMSPEDFSARQRRNQIAWGKLGHAKAEEKPAKNQEIAKKRNKFGAQKTEIDGIVFDSKKESRRYVELKSMEDAGEISNLTRQKVFLLIPKQRKPSGGWERAATYSADFRYIKDGEWITEDVKSAPTRKKQDYVIRRKLLLQVHGIELIEI